MATLIIIDMQVGMTWPTSAERNNSDAEKVVAKLLANWRSKRGNIVHVRHISRTPGSPFWPGQPGVEFQPALAPLPTEFVVEKNVPDAFVRSGLERWLHIRGETAVVIVGVSTNNSVEATARTSGNLGFRTYVVADATFTFDKIDFDGLKRSAAEVHAMSLANLQDEYASVINSVQAYELVQV
jgi:nicotinamidase-related amidase